MARMRTVRFLSAVRTRTAARCKLPFALRKSLPWDDTMRTKEIKSPNKRSDKRKCESPPADAMSDVRRAETEAEALGAGGGGSTFRRRLLVGRLTSARSHIKKARTDVEASTDMSSTSCNGESMYDESTARMGTGRTRQQRIVRRGSTQTKRDVARSTDLAVGKVEYR